MIQALFGHRPVARFMKLYLKNSRGTEIDLKASGFHMWSSAKAREDESTPQDEDVSVHEYEEDEARPL